MTVPNNQRPPLRYNFVFFFMASDFWEAYFGKSLYEHPQVRVYKTSFSGALSLERLFHYHWAYSVNRKIELPLKSIWFKRMYRQDFDNGLPICFVYCGGNSIYHDGGWLEFVRRQDPLNAHVVLHLDLISKKLKDYPYDSLRRKVDLCVTYDRSEAAEYGIHCFDANTYTQTLPLPCNPTFKQDVFFLAAAKDRMPEIIAAYDRLSAAGLRCKFMIAYAPEAQRVQRPGIEYLEREISYEENLQHVIESRCVLEITQHGATGMSLRAREALAYQRRLISNVVDLDESLYHEGQLVRFGDVSEIDVAAVAAPYDQGDYVPLVPPDPISRLYDLQEALDGRP